MRLLTGRKINEHQQVTANINYLICEVDELISPRNNSNKDPNLNISLLNHDEKGLLLEYKLNLVKSLVYILNPPKRERNVKNKRNKSKRRSRNK